MRATSRASLLICLNRWLHERKFLLFAFVRLYALYRCRRLANVRRNNIRYSLKSKLPDQIHHLRQLVGVSDQTCRDNLRMNIDTFNRLCFLLENVGGLRQTRNVSIPEQVAIFLKVLAHHDKQVVLRTDFKRSTYTISKHFKSVMKSLLLCSSILLVTPEPVSDDCDDNRWKCFKGCLGALDGTYIGVRVPSSDKARYRNQKGDVSVNVLAACNADMNFFYILTGWEGSAADSRILRDAVTRPNGLKVPHGKFYLVDNGYTNGDGFLAPYRGVRYHLQEFSYSAASPQNYKEYFNLKHAKARNCIERAFGILKSRWGILRSPAFYRIKTQNLIIMACCLLHNFIRANCDYDPEEANVADYVASEDIPNNNDDDYIERVEPTQEWTAWRETLAVNMYNDWMSSR